MLPCDVSGPQVVESVIVGHLQANLYRGLATSGRKNLEPYHGAIGYIKYI